MDACAQGEALPRLNPVNNNVVFCSARHKWSFTLESYARHYAAFFGAGLDARQFARRLWGNCYFNYQTRRFEGKPADARSPRSFVQFCLEPMSARESGVRRSYKVYAQVLGTEVKDLTRLLGELRISLNKKQLRLDAEPLLKLVMRQFFRSHGGFIDALTQTVPSPVAGAEAKVRRTWRGDATSALGRSMCACDAKGALMVNVVKMFRTPDAEDFLAFGRVLSGVVKSGMEVDVLGER